VPPLRNRGDDIGLLFEHFFAAFSKRHRARRREVDSEVLRLLGRYRWPGNVRELRSVCERLVIFGGDPVTEEDLPSAFFAESPTPETGLVRFGSRHPTLSLKDFKSQCEKEYIESVLRRTRWNVSAAARLLEIQRTYLHQKISNLGIRRPGVPVEV
jgi:two-component system nitrogen regulation response regulator NtrX